ncbi:hypothetical protein EDB81DRAFT_634786 [Dactylonectria macrodidyma]|uniref:WW domain-containing protein n=1 Tax=Dactylonectria macrodidyma TaxID=307937 RepID=A0A9P9FS43_9HYPO|nr:hypothetical protein EDB81DRAFT_634786 [Dactylonectria macrodidyma]
MSSSNLSSLEAPHGGNGPPLPPGWLANWSPEHNAWYYVFPPTGVTQWEFPTAPQDQQQYPAQDPQAHSIENPPNDAAVGEATQPIADGDRGLGKTAFALGGSFLVGSSLRNKFENHHGSHGQQHGIGKMTQSMTIAGAGAIGTKLLGLFGNKQQQQQPVVQTTTHTHTHFYPVYVPGPQGTPEPSYHGQYPPSDPNYAQITTSATVGVVPDPNNFASPLQTGGTPVPLQGASGLGTFPTQNGPPLHIYGAVFADKDVTQIVRSLVTPQQTFQIKGESLTEQLGDPWPEAGRKMFNVLYSYGDRPMELIAAE